MRRPAFGEVPWTLGEVADGLRDMVNRWQSGNHTIDDAADDIKDVVSDLDEMRDGELSAWQPTSRVRPSEPGLYLVATYIGNVIPCYYGTGGWVTATGLKPEVTHWIPLPDPPESTP